MCLFVGRPLNHSRLITTFDSKLCIWWISTCHCPLVLCRTRLPPCAMQDQTALAASNPNNPLLQYRGNAGTHDLELGSSTLRVRAGREGEEGMAEELCKCALGRKWEQWCELPRW